MAYQDNNNRPQRQLIDVTSMNITCSECNAPITQLPFEPSVKEDGTYGKLFCYECNKKRVKSSPPRRDFGGYRDNR